MADKETINILIKGSSIWNEWRSYSGVASPDLANTDISNLDLSHANLSGCILKGTSLSNANLRSANLEGANLTGAFLTKANLSGASLKSAQLRYADLSGAILSHVDLTDADLTCAFLGNADLSYATFAQTSLGATVLTGVKGLMTCTHSGFSVVDHRTITSLVRDGGDCVKFLLGCGIPSDIIDYLPSLLIKPIKLYSCFISYSRVDAPFARRLYDRLTSQGVNCWLDEHRMVPGESMFELIHRGISLWDKVLLCCSRSALEASLWVDREIDAALIKEEQLNRTYGRKASALIPLNLDGFVYTWNGPKASYLQSRYILDFSDWQSDQEKFSSALARLVEALQCGDKTQAIPAEKE